MQSEPKSNAPSVLYTGLRQEFATRCRNLCRHSLSPELWNTWQELNIKTKSRTINFPINGSEDEKLEFVDHYLFELLLPKNMAPANRNMLPRWRADLNKYRGWLLHRVLLQSEVLSRTPDSYNQYRLPEDLPKTVDDLYLFHKHINGEAANISNYRSLNDLAGEVSKYQLPYPISHSDRAMAHARHLKTDSPSQLEVFLPEGWRVTKSMVTTADGTEIKRTGGAKLIAVLTDGTEVIQLKTEKASRAYGSPRWCTAYSRGNTYFKDYKDDLTVVLAPDGQRWQIHARTGQYCDANDNQIKLGTLLKDYIGLEEILAPLILSLRPSEDAKEFLNTTRENRTHSAQGYAALSDTISRMVMDVGVNADNLDFVLQRCLANFDWEKAFAPRLGELVEIAIRQVRPAATIAILNCAYGRSDIWVSALADHIDNAVLYLVGHPDFHSPDKSGHIMRNLVSDIERGEPSEWGSQISNSTRWCLLQRQYHHNFPEP